MARDFDSYLIELQSRGRYAFTLDEAVIEAKGNRIAAKRALARLSDSGRVASVYRGFYVLVPYEYAAKRIIPAEWFVDSLFTHIGLPYYVGLLSAAQIHSAAHQQPQEYQIVVSKPMRSIDVRGVRIRFHVRSRIDRAVLRQIKTQTGTMNVSDPATTALDLVRFQRSIGGVPRLSELFSELGESIEAVALVEAAGREPVLAVVQRAGFLLEQAGYGAIAEHLFPLLRERKARYVQLDESVVASKGVRDERWRVVFTDTEESR